MESSDSRGRSHQRTPLRSACSTIPGHRGSQPVPGPCPHYCYGTLLSEAGLHVPVCAGSTSSHPAMPRLQCEDPEDPPYRRTSTPECPSRRPLSGLEYGCAGAPTCQFGRSSVLAHVEGRLQQLVQSHTPQQHDQREGIAGPSNGLCAVWLSLAGSHGQRHVLLVAGDARGFPTGRCPTHLHTDIQSTVQLRGKDSQRPQHHAACPVPPTCCRLGGSATCRTPSSPQRCPREHGGHSIHVPVRPGTSNPAGRG